jgi:hypothetical protein
MSGANDTVSSTKGKSTLVRPRFGPGMLLQHDDLEQITAYSRDLSRLLFRSFFGCGVVCGLRVAMEENCGKLCVSVEEGLALTCEGDPIYVPKKTTFSVDENCELDEDELWVVLCGLSKCCSPRSAACPTDEDEMQNVCTRERDWFEIKVVRRKPDCVCACGPGMPGWLRVPDDCQCIKTVPPPSSTPPQEPRVPECYRDHYDGKCGCDCEDCEGNCGDCILLAHLTLDNETWFVDHSVRRFVRPILMRDPQSRIAVSTTRPQTPSPTTVTPKTTTSRRKKNGG